MIETLIWLIAFGVILFLTLRSWEGSLGHFFEKKMPAILVSGGDDRWVWCPAIAILLATFIVKPVDMLFTLIVLAIVAWVAKLIIGWALSKAKLH
ncbi:hypothetical protein [Pistricoccus aurantiacus]|uniref:Uncharacterized protein n=1 Tax=Pistricoccus aurantiacus TaxID=1883414 RepID=A0A5B8SS02_9GAMM|nr:hypothetical protein [Pistricoccus aurantiacus]QEA39426.1 hypothetical protein FGL86_10290 [Pistricoccus aurantiacus]